LLNFLFRLFTNQPSKKNILSKKQIKKLEKLINCEIKNPNYFIEAFTHRSVLDHKIYTVSNERMEFLGDSILGFITAEYLYQNFPNKDEGYLTKIRSNFVNKNSLYDAAIRIDLIHYIYVSEEIIGYLNYGIKTILADSFEALIGAIYLDCGLSVTKKFINKYLIEPNLKLGLHLVDENYKSQLLEFSQSQKIDLPKYYVIKEEGPEHDRTFTVEVRIGNEIMGTGKGRNKKSAEQEAAYEALKKLNNNTPKISE